MSETPKIDPSTISTKEAAVELYYAGIRKYLIGKSQTQPKKKTVYNMIALTEPVRISEAIASTFSGASAIKKAAYLLGNILDNKTDKFIFRGRIDEVNSPHNFIPDPCSIEFADKPTEAAKLIAMHTLVVSTDSTADQVIKVGDVVSVRLINNSLQMGELVGLNTTMPVASDPTACQKISELISPEDKFSFRQLATTILTTMGSFMPSSCGDTSQLDPNWATKTLTMVIANNYKSKKYTDVLALDGGSIGIAHFAAGGLNSLYRAMGDSITQKYFGRSVSGLISFSKSKDTGAKGSGPCKGSTGVGKNDDGTGCYAVGWWRKGMEAFVKDPRSEEIQDKAWYKSKAQGVATVIGFDPYGWSTSRQYAIAAGIANSKGVGGFKRLAAANGYDAEKTLSAYAALSAHKMRRANLINQHFPCAAPTAPASPPPATTTTPETSDEAEMNVDTGGESQ